VVLAREDTPGNKRLVAYVLLSEEVETIISDLRRWVKRRLPDYMVPSAFVLLDELPLTANGKLDRRKLPAPDCNQFLENTYFAPRNPLESLLSETWQKILEIQPIGVKDNFFDLGGHSLLAVRLFSELEKVFNRKLPLATLFQAPTIEQLAILFNQEGWSPSWSSLVPIQPGGSKPPLFCLHLALGHVLFYRDLAHYLGPDQPVYAIQPKGLDGTQPQHKRIEEMASYYITVMRAQQPEGPYYLCGSSFGGLIAFEMAQQLQAQGHTVGLVALFDTYARAAQPEERVLSYKVYRFIQRLDLHLRNLLLLDLEGKVKYVREKAIMVKGRVEGTIRNWTERTIKKVGTKFSSSNGHFASDQYEQRIKDLRQLRKDYVPQVYPGRVTLFRASKQPAGYNYGKDLGWELLAAGGLVIYEIPGHHGSIVTEPRVRILAERLQECLSSTSSIG
jgi:thioesterase domain-containing protein/acyl carrier protein